MAKDPAMLWYWSDWFSGTSLLSRFLKGCYIDLLHAHFNHGRLSLEEIKTCLGSDFGTSWPTLQKKFKQDENGLFFNERLEEEKEKRKSYTESRRQSRLKCDEDQVRIYMIIDTDTLLYKIGSSVDPNRRFLEMCNQQNPAITVGIRNYELYWVSDICKRTVEKELHEKFKAKRVKGEWFKLNSEDVLSITQSYEGSYEKRTYERTENVNENSKTVLKKEADSFKLWTTEKNLFLNDEQWVYKLCTAKGIPKARLENLMQSFIQDIELKEDYKDQKELKRHFTNWFNKHKDLPTGSQNTSNGTGRKIQEERARAIFNSDKSSAAGT